MSSVHSSTGTGILGWVFWVGPPQNFYPWQKSSSKVTEMISMPREGFVVSSAGKVQETTNITSWSSSHMRQWSLMSRPSWNPVAPGGDLNE